MTTTELAAKIQEGERWFNNGSKRSRQVVGIDAYFIYYRTGSSRYTSGILLSKFAKWAKGTGKL